MCVFVYRNLFTVDVTTFDCWPLGRLAGRSVGGGGVTMHGIDCRICYDFTHLGDSIVQFHQQFIIFYSFISLRTSLWCATEWMRLIQLKLIVVTGQSMRSNGIDVQYVCTWQKHFDERHKFIYLFMMWKTCVETPRTKCDTVIDTIKSFNFLKSEFWLALSSRERTRMLILCVNFV